MAAAKGFIRHLPGEEALELLSGKMALPNVAEFKEVLGNLEQALKEEHHYLARYKLIEAQARLTRNESFIQEQLLKPLLHFDPDNPNEVRDLELIFPVLERLAYYTEALTHHLISTLDNLPDSVAREALTYLAVVPFIPENDRQLLLDYLQKTKNDERADLVLRNRAFETLFGLWDVLLGTE